MSVGPVDIEFALKSINFGQEAAKMKEEIKGVTDYTQAASKVMTSAMGDFSKQSAKDMKDSIQIQKSVIKDLQQSIRELNDTVNNSTGKNKTNAQSALGTAKKDLIAEQGALIAMQKEQTALNAREAESQIPIIGGLGKWAIGIFSVAAAMKIGKDIIGSTEGTTRVFNQVVAEAEAGARYFFKTLASGDWSNFWQGLERSVTGAKEMVKQLEEINNLRNEQKGIVANLDRDIAVAMEGTYDKDPAHRDDVLKNIQTVIDKTKEKYKVEADLNLVAYQTQLKQTAKDNNTNTDFVGNTIIEYSKHKEEIDLGEKYNEVLQKRNTLQDAYDQARSRVSNIQKPQSLIDAQAELDDLVTRGGVDAGKIAAKYLKLTEDEKNKLSDLYAAWISADAQSQHGPLRMENRKSTLVEQFKKDDEAAAKKAKEDAELENRIKDTQEKMKTANGQEMADLAKKLTALQDELRLRKEIYDQAMMTAWTNKFKGQSYQPITTKGTSGVSEFGNQGIDAIGNQKTVQGILYEITAIDKTGPTWEKVKLEYSDLKKFEKKAEKDVEKDQEKEDKDAEKQKEITQYKIVTAAKEFTSELTTQLGLTRDQAAALQGITGIFEKMMSGDYAGAAISWVGMFSEVFTKYSKNAITLEQITAATSKLYSTMSALLNTLNGPDLYANAQAQLNVYNNDLNTYWKNLKGYKTWVLAGRNADGSLPKIDTSGYTELSQWVALLNTLKNNSGGNWITHPDYIKVQGYVDNILATNESILQVQNQIDSKILGFNSSDVASSMTQGIEDGLKIADNGLGGFALSFGDQIKQAMVKGITDAMQTTLNAGFISDLKTFLQPGSDGGATLTPAELSILESDYSSAANQGSVAYKAIKPILDKYGVGDSASTASATAITGIAASATEETTSAMVGQLMGVRVDIKSILATMAIGQDDVGKNLLYLKQISENTSHNIRLINIEKGIDEMNTTLKARL